VVVEVVVGVGVGAVKIVGPTHALALAMSSLDHDVQIRTLPRISVQVVDSGGLLVVGGVDHGV
jgi:hypothetical protein